jgi:ABC-type phosphate transport system substrate-binding protein
LAIFQVRGQTSDSLACIESEGCTSIVGGGASAAADQIQQWSLFFGMERPNVNLQFIPSGGVTTTYIQTPCKAKDDPDWDGICYHNHTYMYDYAVINYDPHTNPDLGIGDAQLSVPLYSIAIVLAHKIAGLTADTPLYLSRNLIYKIFNFEITNWNDPTILQFNQLFNKNIKLPNATIKVVLRSDESGLTKMMNQFMTSVNPKWNSSGLYWGGNTTGNPNAVFASGSFASTNAVLQRANSIGFVPLNYALTAGLFYANIQNRAGKVLLPTASDALQSALNNTIDDNFNADPVDAPGDASYPLSMTAFLVALKTTNANCDMRAQMFKFWKWTLSDPSAIAHCDATPGFAPLSPSLAARVVAEMQKVTCMGKPSLAATFVESSSTPLRVAMTVIAVLFMIATVGVFVILVWKRENRISKATGLVFSGVFLLGCFLNFLGVTLWALVPSTSTICDGRAVLVTLGVALAIIAMFTKTWSIYNIWTHMPKTESSHFEEVPSRQLGTYTGLMVAFQVLVLALWFGTIHTTSQISIVDAIDVLAVHVCSPDTTLWKFLQFAYMAIFAFWTIYLAYKTTDFWTKHQLANESQNILTSIVNGLFWTGVLVPMTVLLKSAETSFFLTAVALIFPTAFAIVNIFLPKLFFIFDTNTASSKIASFLSGNEQMAGYRPPASSIDCEDLSPSNTARSNPTDTPAKSRGIPDLPTVEEKEAKKDSPLVWYRQLDNSVPASDLAEAIGGVVAQTEGGRDSPSNTTSTGYFTHETSRTDIPEPSGRGGLVTSPSLEMTRMAITEE